MSEIQILTATHGIAPRSDELLRIGGDVERGRLEQSVFDSKLRQETNDWLNLQQQSGVDIQEDGKLGWQDHLRPIVKASLGFASDIDNAPVTRWGTTNTFYRKPTIIGTLELDDDLFDQEISVTGEHVSLLSPYSFAEHCNDTYEDVPTEFNVLGLYTGIISKCEQRGISRITLLENIERSRNSNFIIHSSKSSELVEVLTETYPSIQFSHIQSDDNNGDFGVSIPTDCPPNLGVDVGEHTLEQLERVAKAVNILIRPVISHPREAWRSVINASNTSKDDIIPTDSWVRGIEKTHPERIILTHSTDLQYLPLPYAQEKIKRLGEAKEQLKRAIGE